jgi:hypothetical protein
VAITVEHPLASTLCRTIDVPAGIRLEELIDSGTLYVARDLTVPQLATLQAIASRIIGTRHRKRAGAPVDSTLVRGVGEIPAAVNYPLGLDELDTIARTRTSYAFAELPDEIQDAILGLITTGDLTSGELDLAVWLEQLYAVAAAR